MVVLEVSVSKGFLAKDLGRVFDRDYYFQPRRRHEIDSRCHGLVERELSDIGACFTESNLGRAEFIAADQVLIGGIQPNMILGMLLGAEFVPGMDKDADITPECCRGVEPAELPPPKKLLRHPLIQTFDDQFCAVKQEGRRQPIPPFFWDSSGRAAIHGALTTAQKFFGDRVFIDLLAEPQRCGAVMRWITETYLELIAHYAALSKTEITEIHVGECSACMVGPKVIEEFVLPEASRLGEVLGPVRFHTCGQSGHFLASCAQINNLASLDVGGENSLGMIRNTFGADFPVSIAPLTRDLCAEQPDALLDWTRRVLDENRGGPLSIVCHLEPEYNLEAIRSVARLLRDGMPAGKHYRLEAVAPVSVVGPASPQKKRPVKDVR